MDAHKLDVSEVCEKLNTSIDHGLTDEQAQQLLDHYGPNNYLPPNMHPDSFPHRMIPEFLGVTNICCLLIQILLSLILGLIFLDIYLITIGLITIFLTIFFLCIAVITIRNILIYSNLSSNTKHKCKVIRNQKTKCQLLVSGYLKKHKIITKEYEMKMNDDITNLIGKYCRGFVYKTILQTKIVPGDIVLLDKGNAIRADMRVCECSDDFKVDNSSLTGQSEAQQRIIDKSDEEIPFDALNLVFDGTFCVKGNGKCIVVNTGNNTLISSIATLATISWHWLADDFSARMTIKTQKKIIFALFFGIIALVVNLFVLSGNGKDILGIIASVYCGIVVLIGVGIIIGIVVAGASLRIELSKKGLDCKFSEVERTLAYVNVIVADVDNDLNSLQRGLSHASMTIDGGSGNGIGDGDGDAGSDVVGIRKTIELCNKLGISLIVTTKYDEDIAHNISRQIFENDKNISVIAVGGNKNKNKNTKARSTENKRELNLFYETKIDPDPLLRQSEFQANININIDTNTGYGDHTCFANVTNSMQKFKIIQNAQEFKKCVLFISNNVDDTPCLKKCDVGIALADELSSDIEKYACDMICKSNNPLKTIVESIEIAQNIKQSFIYKIVNRNGNYF